MIESRIDPETDASQRRTALLTRGDRACLRCGFTVELRPWGCKNPCRNCGFVYPLGDCSD